MRQPDRHGYTDILASLRHWPIDAALFMVSPPDADGMCSFGPVVDFLPDLWRHIPVRIAHVNPSMPRTRGHEGIPYTQLTAIVTAEQPLLGTADGGSSDASADAIARHIAARVADGAVVQVGLGRIPGAVLRQLRGRRNLKIHSGLIGDAVLDLLEAGALAPDTAITGGVAIGTPQLYAAVSAPAFQFKPVSHTHNPAVIAGLKDFVAINSALEVDLFGQAYTEVGPGGLMSGPGGASDFARGAKAGGGLRIIALPATAAAGAISRIVLPGGGGGPVSLGRMDIDLVVTEYGVADLRECGHEARALALAAIAAPAHREGLILGWQTYSKKL